MRRSVLVTGANGYIGNAVAKAFARAGWQTYGLVRRDDAAADLARNEIHPVIGSPADLSWLNPLRDVSFDVVVSNTDDTRDSAGHFAAVQVMLDAIGRRGGRAGVRTLVMFTSGCKDYGAMACHHGDAGLSPHTEGSPLNPPAHLVARATLGAQLLEQHGAAYDATVLRPTIVYGNASSHYGPLFDLASGSETVLKILGEPDAIMHSLHVDDCAQAYVALAEHPDRGAVAQQAFNVSNTHYETARQVGEALAHSYRLTLAFATPSGPLPARSVHSLANFSQWVSSDKLRALTGWRERRATFVAGIDEYRLAFESWKQIRQCG